MKYAICRENPTGYCWLQNIVSNEKYCPSSKAPTMGTRHDVSEFRTVWGTEPVFFEKLTLLNYEKVLLEEYRWKDLLATPFTIIPMCESGD